MVRTALHHALRVILQRRDLSLAALARLCGWRRQRLHKLLTADAHGRDALDAIAAALGITYDDLRGQVADEYRRAVADGVELRGPLMVSERRVRPA